VAGGRVSIKSVNKRIPAQAEASLNIPVFELRTGAEAWRWNVKCFWSIFFLKNRF